MKIGENIKKHRKGKMTQQQLATSLNVSQSMVAQYENGIRIPKISTLLKIAEVLKVSVAELYGDSEALLQDFKMQVIEENPTLRVAYKNNQTDSFLYESTLNKRIIEKLDITEDKQELLVLYNQLNELGQLEAKKRIKELAFIPEYTDENKK